MEGLQLWLAVSFLDSHKSILSEEPFYLCTIFKITNATLITSANILSYISYYQTYLRYNGSS